MSVIFVLHTRLLMNCSSHNPSRSNSLSVPMTIPAILPLLIETPGVARFLGPLSLFFQRPQATLHFQFSQGQRDFQRAIFPMAVDGTTCIQVQPDKPRDLISVSTLLPTACVAFSVEWTLTRWLSHLSFNRSEGRVDQGKAGL